MEIFRTDPGTTDARRHFHSWRVFFMACAELFGYRGGSEWFVVHSLLSPGAAARGGARHPTLKESSCAS